MIVPEAGLQAIARAHLPFGITRTLYAAQPLTHAVRLPASAQLGDVMRASRTVMFPGSARPTTSAIMQTSEGWMLMPLGIIRTGSGERVLGPIRLHGLRDVMDTPLTALQQRAHGLVGLVDDSLHTLLY